MINEVADVTVSFTAIRCGSCGVRFALDKSFMRDRRNDQQTFYCPNGHPRWYPPGDSDEDRLRKELAAAQSRASALANHGEYLSGQLRETEKALTIKKGLLTRKTNELTKVKTRVAAGVCPDCNRSFQNVARHMATKHPKE